MKLLMCSLLLVVTATLGVVADEDTKSEDGVLVLTGKNYKKNIDDNEYILVEFYAPWCGHCKSLAPEYAKAAQTLAASEEYSNIKLAKVDATAESELAAEMGIRGYPTLKFYSKGSPSDYKGGREADQIVSWLIKKTGPAAEDLSSVEAVHKFKTDNAVSIIGFFENVESAKVFIAVAGDLDKFAYGIVTNADVCKEIGHEFGSIVIFKPNNESIVFDKELTVENVKKFIEIKHLPLIVEFNHESASDIFGGQIKSHLLFFISVAAGHIEKHVDPLRAVAERFRDDILFVTISADDENHARIFEFFGMTKEETPTIRLIKLEEDMAKFKPENNDLSAESITSFLQKFLDGDLKQHLLSQELPEDWDKKPVKVLVASNFDEVVMDKTKDVLVEFYAPWCGHCKQLAPIYDQLAEKYEDNDSVIIAKIDSTANELEHTKVSSFPTIKFYPKGDKKVIDYNLDRSFDDFVKFIDAGGDVAHPDDEEKVEEEEEHERHEKDEL